MTAAHYAGLSRVGLTIAGAYALLQLPEHGRAVAAAIVGLAIVTDILDGLLARRHGTVSSFGAILDLTADKVFFVPMLFLATMHEERLLWCSVIIAMRDFLLMGVRMHAAASGLVIPAERAGKIKSTVLYPALVCVLLNVPGASLLLGLAALLAVWSAAVYIRMAWPVLDEGLNPSTVI